VAFAPLLPRLHPQRRVHLLLLHLFCFPTEPVAIEHAQASSTTARTRVLTRVGCSSRHRSPPAATPRHEHRLHLAHPALISVCHGKEPFNGNRSPEHSRAHWRALLRGLPLSAPSPVLFFTCTSTALRRGCSRASPFTMPWPGMPHWRPPALPLCHVWQWPAS
jgi:hypothetical protein